VIGHHQRIGKASFLLVKIFRKKVHYINFLYLKLFEQIVLILRYKDMELIQVRDK